MKTMDIKPIERTNLGHWEAWRNYTQTRMVEITGKKIEVVQVDTSKLSEAKKALCKAYSHYNCICGEDK